MDFQHFWLSDVATLKGYMRNLQIQYDNYFEESPTGAPADLIQLLQEQDIAEKAEYVNLVKSQLEGTDEITTAEAKIAFMSIDPGINIEIINTYLSVSFDLEYRGVELIRTMEIVKKSSELAAPCRLKIFILIYSFHPSIKLSFYKRPNIGSNIL